MLLNQPLFILLPLFFFYYLIPIYLGYYIGRSSKSLTTLLLPLVVLILFYLLRPQDITSSSYNLIIMLPVIIFFCAGGGFGILKRKENLSQSGPCIIGLTGLPCSGKSEASRILQELGAMIIDVDKLGHVLLEQKDVIEKIYDTFGESVLTADEKISRNALGQIVFSNPQKLKELEDILHPAMIKRIQQTLELLSDRDVLILDAAILHKMNLDKICDRVIVVSSEEQIRLRRAATRNWDKEELKKRDKAVKEQLKLTDITLIENNTDIIDLKIKIESIWNKDILNER